MAETFDRDQRNRIRDAYLKTGELPACPACGDALVRHEVGPKRELAYVRRRMLLICRGCRRAAAFDLKGDAPP